MIRFRKRKKKDQESIVIDTLESKLQELIQVRNNLEEQEGLDIDFDEKKKVVQQIIEVTHHIQALREVIGLIVE